MINAQAVRAARLRAGFRTQQQLAEAVGCARQTINRAEKGRSGATILQRIALVLGVPPEALMEPAESMSNTAPTPEEHTVLAALRKLDPVVRAKAVGYVIGLAEGGGAEEAASLGADLMGDLTAAEEKRAARLRRERRQTGDTSA